MDTSRVPDNSDIISDIQENMKFISGIRISYMREFWPEIFILLLVLLVLSLVVTPEITGFSIHQLSVSVNGKMKGEISAFVYDPLVNITKPQKIYVEFLNSGTENYSVKLETFVYFYEDGKLEEMAYYYDSTVELFPGMRRPFESVFVPNEMGTYYIKARVNYGTKRIEAWGSFYVTYPDYIPYIPAEYQPIVTYVEVNPSLSLEYPESVDTYPGRSVLTNIKVKNTGNATLHEVKLQLSATNMLDIDLNPKDSYYLEPGETLVFLMDIYANNNISIGEYPVDFELITREVKETGTISVNVRPYNMSLEEEVRKTIQNYEYLINELQREIIEATANDLDVTAAQVELDQAKEKLQEAKDYYDSKEYENAMDVLDEIKDILKDVALKLSQASFTVFVAPAFSPYWILIIAILMAIIFLLFFKKRKKKEKPKLLRASEGSET